VSENRKTAGFSVLMSAYHATRGDELARCLESIRVQSLRPDEVVLVYDGPVSDEIGVQVQRYRESLEIRTVDCHERRGLGHALRVGLAECRNPMVARMDTDDVCLPDRFKRQIAFMDNHPEVSVLGGLMAEHYRTKEETLSYVRRTPLEPDAVRSYARFRNPVNHPTAMFRKHDVEVAGGYQPIPLFEDYHLWVRMLMRGYEIANLDEVLVEGNASPAFFSRRGGRSYVRQEMKLAGEFRRLGYHSYSDTVRFITRLPYRGASVCREWLPQNYAAPTPLTGGPRSP
jgi:amylovoran biosynthesis glycosyltransferase AmsE